MTSEELRNLLERSSDEGGEAALFGEPALSPEELRVAWCEARREAAEAYAAWCRHPGCEGYAAYRAAADRADAAEAALAVRSARETAATTRAA
jgi:hypothetical protein